ncbi:MAG: biotin--[acetyl-CoA-carboxylase] ligase [bacterium]
MSVIGKRLLTFYEVTSTNDMAKREAEQGAEEGLVVVAREQTQGRGRRGRGWVSRPGLGVYLSVVLRPETPDAESIAILGGVATAEVMQNFGIEGVTIKWPNDVLVNGRKIAGVLVEPRMGKGRVEFAVLGIGVNVRHAAGDWPEALKNVVTSILCEGCDVECDVVVSALLRSLDAHYAKPDSLLEAWSRWSGSPRLPVID